MTILDAKRERSPACYHRFLVRESEKYPDKNFYSFRGARSSARRNLASRITSAQVHYLTEGSSGRILIAIKLRLLQSIIFAPGARRERRPAGALDRRGLTRGVFVRWKGTVVPCERDSAD